MRINRLGQNVVEHCYADAKKVLVSYDTAVAILYPDGRMYVSASTFSTATQKHFLNWLGGNQYHLKYISQQEIEALS